MQVQVTKWGNSLALRIPKPFAEDAGVSEGSAVELSVEDGKIVASPIRQDSPTLRQLLVKVNKSNLHGEVDTGAPVGREVW